MANLKKAFADLDKEGRGFVKHEEALQILKEKLTAVPELTLRALLTRFDVNKDYMIDYGEFVKFYENLQDKKAALEAKFEQLDTDNSGDLDKDETVAIIAEECALDPMMASCLIDDFDLDKNGTLDKQEFMLMWTKLF